MEVTFTSDKNGATSAVVEGATVVVAPNTMLEIVTNGQSFNGGSVNSENRYRCALPLSSSFIGTIEVRVAGKFWEEDEDGNRVRVPGLLIDSLTIPAPAEVTPEAEEAPVKKTRKKAL